MKIVGIGGLPRSGKDTVADYFIKKGFLGVSLGDIVREYSRERHSDQADPISVKNMTETSNWLRSQKGADFALKEALGKFNKTENIHKYKGLVVFSVRAPVEADYILEHGGELIWIEASEDTRYKRAMDNLRQGEARISIEEFKSQENLQNRPQPGTPKNVQMNTSYIKSKATTIIENNGNNIDEFMKKVRNLV